MRRHRRLVLIDRVIPFLAALVGLIALAGAVIVQLNTGARTAAVSAELVALREAVTALQSEAEQLAVVADNGTAEGLLALQSRMQRIEAEWQQVQETQAAAVLAPAPLAFPEADAPQQAAIDPDLPTTDCIPLGTRFMVVPNDSYPMCQSRAVIEVGMITGDSVDIAGAGLVVEAGFANLPGSTCTVMVFSADAEGFAELRVSCT